MVRSECGNDDTIWAEKPLKDMENGYGKQNRKEFTLGRYIVIDVIHEASEEESN